MAIVDAMREEFAYESSLTRKVLERLPDDKFGWRPAEKSWTAGELATHIANLGYWVVVTMDRDEYDVTSEDQTPVRDSSAELLAFFDDMDSKAQAALTGVGDEKLAEPWRLKAGEATILEMPRGQVLRTLVFNHRVHHRGQLTIYLRLLGVPLPSIYGPSADES